MNTFVPLKNSYSQKKYNNWQFFFKKFSDLLIIFGNIHQNNNKKIANALKFLLLTVAFEVPALFVYFQSVHPE